jgi:putative membrane protein
LSAQVTDTRHMALPALVSAGLVTAVGALILALTEPGPLSIQMTLHIAVMNVISPLLGIYGAQRLSGSLARPAVLAAAGVAQMLLLWGWHVPAVQLAAATSPILHVGLLVMLAGSGVLFWSVVLRLGSTARWRSVAALMLSGKLACLLGVLLIFAPRDVYGIPGVQFLLCSTGPSSLADQQLAGLLMITACPLSYVAAGVVLAAQMMGDFERSAGPRVAGA